MSVDVHQGDAEGLDRSRRYLRPVRSYEPGEVHLAVYEWLPTFEAWATGPGICGKSMRQGALPEGAEVTCSHCERFRPTYEAALAGQVAKTQGVSSQGMLREKVRAAVKASGLKQVWIAEQLGVSQRHLSHLLTGRAVLTLLWADRILALCGMELVVVVRPKQAGGR